VSIDGIHFTPMTAVAGGLLIGLATALFVLLNGRIAGISGIVAGLLRPTRGDTGWRTAFIAGLVAAPILYAAVAVLPDIEIDAGWISVAVGGFIVGIGTRYGSGCTSGHGVCGVARLSARGLVATLVFMAGGIVTVFLVRHLIGT
jgi:uncharacterized membrane protein YedE/YeeE